MDQNESTLPLTISNSRPISPPPVRETAVAAPATVDNGISGTKRKRGRPKVYERDAKEKFTSQAAIEKKRLLVNSKGDDPINYEGGDFKTHWFIVNKGENIIKRIMYFTRNRSRAITVLAATGQVANVKIQKLGLSGEVVRFKEAYDIISLSCSLTISESQGMKVKTGEWVITIGGAGGGIFGGTLVSRLIAASPVQVVIGSFLPLVSYPPQERNDETKVLVVAPTLPNSLASSSTRQVIQPDMIGPSQSQKRNTESKAVIVPPTTPNVLASSSTGQVQLPDKIGPSHSQ